MVYCLLWCSKIAPCDQRTTGSTLLKKTRKQNRAGARKNTLYKYNTRRQSRSWELSNFGPTCAKNNKRLVTLKLVQDTPNPHNSILASFLTDEIYTTRVYTFFFIRYQLEKIYKTFVNVPSTISLIFKQQQKASYQVIVFNVHKMFLVWLELRAYAVSRTVAIDMRYTII